MVQNGETMKQLFLIRHAKSDWGGSSVSDFDRELNDRGLTDAPMMGHRLKKRGVVPDGVVSSPAQRARKTAEIICESIGYSADRIEYVDKLYEASIEDLQAVINNLGDQWQQVLLFGHNPTLTEATHYFASASIANVPTCGVVQIEFAVESWGDIGRGSGQLFEFDYPGNAAQ